MATLELIDEGKSKTINLYRCTFCCNLLTDKRIQEGLCVGHRLTEHVELTDDERKGLESGAIG